jgi:hypothetical protein
MLSNSTGDTGDTVARSGWGTCSSASNNMRCSWFVVLAVCVYVLFVVRVTRCMMRVQVHGGGVGRTKGRWGKAWKRGVNIVRLWLALMPAQVRGSSSRGCCATQHNGRGDVYIAGCERGSSRAMYTSCPLFMGCARCRSLPHIYIC